MKVSTITCLKYVFYIQVFVRMNNKENLYANYSLLKNTLNSHAEVSKRVTNMMVV